MGVIIDNTVKNDILNSLARHNIACYKSYNLDFVYKPINTHPDIQIHFIDAKTAVVAPFAYDYYKSILPKTVTLVKGDKNPGSTYPNDCAYNVARMGKKVIGNLLYTEPKILDLYKKMGFEFINVKQGYAKCNLCIIDENAAITEDEGVFKVLSACGIEVLKIPVGFVKLNGFQHGFIGGTSGFIGDKQLAFYGNLETHPSCNEIKTFIKSREVDIIYLSSTDLIDYGSILYFDDIVSK